MSAEISLVDRPVLVTGATGFLGTHLCRALAAAGARVHALRRHPGGDTRLPVPGIHWHPGEMTDPASNRRAAGAPRPEVVFHLAAYGTAYGQQDEEAAFRVNVEGSLHLFRALEGISARLVAVGSSAEYGRAQGLLREDRACHPTWFYPATKNAAVVLLSTLGRQHGREVVTLRPFGPYGPADNPDRVIPHTLAALLAGREVPLTAGEQVRDFTHVDDCVAAFLAAATRQLPGNGGIYNVGSGRGVRIRDLALALAHAVGPDAAERLRFGAQPYRESEPWEVVGDIAAARADLGYEPRVPLAEGIARTLEEYRRAVPAGSPP
jgi:UDP-glucose 4-epimerase